MKYVVTNVYSIEGVTFALCERTDEKEYGYKLIECPLGTKEGDEIEITEQNEVLVK